MQLYQPTITGSLAVSGSVSVSGSITIAGGGSIAGTASIATTALTASSADNFLTRGTLTAQTIVVQTITSSVDFVTGSTQFGSKNTDIHTYTGSLAISGSSTVGLNVNNGALFVTSSGFVGIGTTNPTVKLDVGYDSNNRSIVRLSSNAANRMAAIRFDGNNAESGYIGYEGGSEIVSGGQQGDLVIRNMLSGKDIILDTNAGNVGIGTTSPSYSLDINGDSKFTVAVNGTRNILFGTPANNYARITYTDVNGELTFGTIAGYGAVFITNNTERLRITSGGQINVGTASFASNKIIEFQADTSKTYNGIVQMNNNVNILYLAGGNGTGPNSGASITLVGTDRYTTNSGGQLILSAGNSSANTTYGYVSLETSGSERMRVTYGGNIGMGGITPRSLVEIQKTSGNTSIGVASNATLTLSQAGAINEVSQIGFGYTQTTSPAVIGFITTDATSYTNGALIFATRNVTTDTAPTERMRISSTGVITMSGSDATYIVQNYSGTSKSFFGTAGSGTDIISGAAAGDTTIRAQQKMLFATGGDTERMRITSGGNVQIDDTASQSKLAVRGGNSTYPASSSTSYTLSLNDPTSAAINVGGSLLFQGYKTSTTNVGNFAGIVGKKENGTGGDESGFLGFLTSNSGGTLSERMRITSGGNIGIGTATPVTLNSADTNLTIYAGQDSSLTLKDSVETWEFYCNDDLYITTGSYDTAAALTIKRLTGNVGIGTNPTNKLDVNGAARFNGTITNLGTGTGTYTQTTWYVDTSNQILFENGRQTDSASGTGRTVYFTWRGGPSTGGGVQLQHGTNAWAAYTSDARMKTKVADVPNGLEAIMKLEPIKFKWTRELENSRTVTGFTAQNVQQAIPDAVFNSWQDEELGDVLSYYQDYLTPYLVKAIQEQQAQIEELKSKLT